MSSIFVKETYICDSRAIIDLPSQRIYCTIVVNGEIVYQTSQLSCNLPLNWVIERSVAIRPWHTVSIFVVDADPSGKSDYYMKGMPQSFMVTHFTARDLLKIPPNTPATATQPLEYLGRLDGALTLSVEVTSQDIKETLLLSPLPDPISDWINLDDDQLDYCWKHFATFLSSNGYDICFEWCPPMGGSTPRRNLLPYPVAKNPFSPSSDEDFVYRTNRNNGRHLSQWMILHPLLHNAYDAYDRLCVIKAVPEQSAELDVLDYLNSEDLRELSDNHTIPLLARFSSGVGWNFAAMPYWEHRIAIVFGWQVDDYLNQAIQAFEGLDFMHRHLVFHCDISPSNITCNHIGNWENQADAPPFPTISTFDYRLAFIDFQLSVRYPPGIDASKCTSTAYQGTPAVMAPEVAACMDEPAPYALGPADVYALASTLIHMEKEETEHLEVILKALKKPRYEGIYARTVLQELVLGYHRILESARHPDPSLRPSAAEVLVRLRALRESIPAFIRFAPEDGYRDYNALMSCAIGAGLMS